MIPRRRPVDPGGRAGNGRECAREKPLGPRGPNANLFIRNIYIYIFVHGWKDTWMAGIWRGLDRIWGGFEAEKVDKPLDKAECARLFQCLRHIVGKA